MNLIDFYKVYPDEETCEHALRMFREHHTLFCSECGGLHLSWNPSHKSWTCMNCGHETTLRSGTVMQDSKLPIFDWFVAMYLIASTKRAISAKEVQHQLGRKRYQPVWEMMHKLRDVMGKRDRLYKLFDQVKLDEGFFSTEAPEEEKDCPIKRGRGSQKKTAVLIMAESSKPDMAPKRTCSTGKQVGHIKMMVITNLKASTEEAKMKPSIDNKAHVITLKKFHHAKNVTQKFGDSSNMNYLCNIKVKELSLRAIPYRGKWQTSILMCQNRMVPNGIL